MSADPAHAEAYRRIEDTWLHLENVPRPALLSAREVEEDDYDGSISGGRVECEEGSRASAPVRHRSERRARVRRGRAFLR